MSDERIRELQRAAADGTYPALLDLAVALERAGRCETWTVRTARWELDREMLVLELVNEFGHRRLLMRMMRNMETFVREFVPAALGSDAEANDLSGLTPVDLVGMTVRARPVVRGRKGLTDNLFVIWRFEALDGKRYSVVQSPPQVVDDD